MALPRQIIKALGLLFQLYLFDITTPSSQPVVSITY